MTHTREIRKRKALKPNQTGSISKTLGEGREGEEEQAETLLGVERGESRIVNIIDCCPTTALIPKRGKVFPNTGLSVSVIVNPKKIDCKRN